MHKSNIDKIRIIDLFSGAGGLTFGFHYKVRRNKFVINKKFDIVFANDHDKSAAEAFNSNFKSTKMFNTSIENIDVKCLKKNQVDIENVDIVIGGPPCQSYSTIGKRLNDDRSKMYEEYRRILDIIKPKMFIFENVLGILSFKTDNGSKIIDKITKEFDEIGYSVNKKILNAKDYGVPQNRLRVFLVGTRKDTKLTWEFPVPNLTEELALNDAISDLPEVHQNEKVIKYELNPTNKYQILLRGNQQELTEHFYGWHGDRISRIISSLSTGESHDDINSKVNLGLLPKDLFLTSGYNNSYGRLWWDKPGSTITNNFGTPSAIRCIHPDQNRAITIREAARIQSFPDWFIFKGTKTEKRSQIGNAVPPLLAIKLAEQVYKTLRG